MPTGFELVDIKIKTTIIIIIQTLVRCTVSAGTAESQVPTVARQQFRYGAGKLCFQMAFENDWCG